MLRTRWTVSACIGGRDCAHCACFVDFIEWYVALAWPRITGVSVSPPCVTGRVCGWHGSLLGGGYGVTRGPLVFPLQWSGPLL